MEIKNKMQEFNQKLVDLKSEIKIIDYIKTINLKFFNIDISFLEDFLELSQMEGFTIHHDLLYKYEILTGEIRSNNVLRLLNQYELENNLHYLLELELLDHSSKDKNIYMLTNDTFKFLAMRTARTRKYANYFSILEKGIKYYNEYQILVRDQKLKDANKKKILELEKHSTLDHFVIVALPDSYGVIRGCKTNIDDVLK